MAFTFTSRLILVCPIGKKSSLNRTLETGMSRDQVLDKVKYWFPVMGRIILNVRQSKRRAYHSLPNFFLLFYEEVDPSSKRQKWKKVYRIKVYRGGTIEVYNYETQSTHSQ